MRGVVRRLHRLIGLRAREDGTCARVCLVGARIRQAARRGAHLIVIDPRAIELVEHATIHLQPRPGTNIPLLHAMARVILAEAPGELFTTFHDRLVFINRVTSGKRDGYMRTPEYKRTALAIERASLCTLPDVTFRWQASHAERRLCDDIACLLRIKWHALCGSEAR